MRKIFKVIKQDTEDATANQGVQSTGTGTANDNAQSKKVSEMTAFGELVYQRNNNKDFVSSNKPGMDGRDEVLEENLLDVKNLLKNSTSS